MIVVYLACLIGAFTIATGVRQILKLRHLMEDGEKVKATIVSVGESTQGRYYKLEFEGIGGLHHMQYPLPRRAEPLAPGTQVDFYYDPSNPDQNHIQGSKKEINNGISFIVMGVVILILGAASYLEIQH